MLGSKTSLNDVFVSLTIWSYTIINFIPLNVIYLPCKDVIAINCPNQPLSGGTDIYNVNSYSIVLSN